MAMVGGKKKQERESLLSALETELLTGKRVVEERTARAARDEETLARRKVPEVCAREKGGCKHYQRRRKGRGTVAWCGVAPAGGERPLLTH